MAKNALCIRCGTFKSDFQDRCPSCDFVPESDTDIVKSRILGPLYSFAFGEGGATVDTGRSRNDLKSISLEIRSGHPYQFPPEEVQHVLGVYRSVKSTTASHYWLTMLPLYLGLVVGIAGLCYVLWNWPR
jgi:hypothetical protein